MNTTVLVLGITGSIGRATAAALHRTGWQLRALHRQGAAAADRVPDLPDVEWFAGDALDPQAVDNAARGCSLILHALNPPGYKNWRQWALPMLDNSIEAAVNHRATLLFPGNVYNFGPDAGTVIAETSPQNPLTRKGEVRRVMEARLADAAHRGLRSIVVRAGDYFGPGAGSTWFENVLVKRDRSLSRVVYPGRHDAAHAWAYLPDLARTFVRLAERREALQGLNVFHFRGHSFERGVELAESIRAVAGVPEAPIRSFPWWLVRLLSPVNTLFRELGEMRYLWESSLTLDNTKLVDWLGEEPHTPLEEALAHSLASMNVLPDTRASAVTS